MKNLVKEMEKKINFNGLIGKLNTGEGKKITELKATPKEITQTET